MPALRDPRAEIVLRYLDVYDGFPANKLTRVDKTDPGPGEFWFNPKTQIIVLGGAPAWPLIATIGGIVLRDLNIAVEPSGRVTLVFERFPSHTRPTPPQEPA